MDTTPGKNIYADLSYQMLVLQRNLNASLTKLGLTRTQLHILSYLSRHDSVTATELAKAVDVSPSTVTWQCDEMEKEQLITRHRSGEDRRVVYVALTEKGQQKLIDVRERRIQQLTKLFEQFEVQDVETFLTLVSKLNRISNEFSQE
ncbi:MarR family winged helix-turn-helix transcriptional regulator [Alicyclobacillus pomorum]|jgi:DNA-binding MarR family transcriptional regulator|uniref:MarR family winged helix-turn-helix transcriptional regulator n=1 Tax=Alicyclobacillus pomorum TaxID=204470 RepID=UPI000688267C|nr:MarR family transcriptional regulator [Alicyclobacillus pomorum]